MSVTELERLSGDYAAMGISTPHPRLMTHVQHNKRRPYSKTIPGAHAGRVGRTPPIAWLQHKLMVVQLRLGVVQPLPEGTARSIGRRAPREYIDERPCSALQSTEVSSETHEPCELAAWPTWANSTPIITCTVEPAKRIIPAHHRILRSK